MTQRERRTSGFSSGCDLIEAWGPLTISKHKVRFVIATDAFAAWWARNRKHRPRRRLRGRSGGTTV